MEIQAPCRKSECLIKGREGKKGLGMHRREPQLKVMCGSQGEITRRGAFEGKMSSYKTEDTETSTRTSAEFS